jgi:hypothetical protein
MALVAFAVLSVPVAHAQDRTTGDRLDRIERDLNMLQRQVYRGAPTSSGGVPSGGPTTGADIEIRMERLEAQMRDLTGRVEAGRQRARSVETAGRADQFGFRCPIQ